MVLRAGGRTVGSDRGRRPTRLTIGCSGFCTFHGSCGPSHDKPTRFLHEGTRLDSCMRAPCPHAGIHLFSYGKAHRSRKRCKTLNTRLSGASAADLDRSPRCDRQLSKPIHDLSILCWDLKALPTHHLPWAGFGLRQSHCSLAHISAVSKST